MEAKHLIVENGQLLVTDKPKPIEPPNQSNVDSEYASVMVDYENAFESWKQEAYKVAGVNDSGECFDWYAQFTRSNKDGIYDAPAGLEYDAVCKGMTKENCHNDEECWDKNKCLCNQQVAILSFASPKEEAPNCNHNFVTRVDGRMVCSFCGAIGFIDFASPEETPASKEKPDFESPRQMIIRLAEEYRGKGKLEKSTEEESSYAWGASRIWNDHVEPRDKQIAALQEEIRQLKEGMGGVVNWIQKVGVDNAIRGSVIIEMIEELKNKQ